jgi:hypothetical protein
VSLLCRFDASGNCAAEVADPSRAYPRALSVTVALVTLCYALPTFVGISVLPNAAAWHTGTFATIAEQVGGRWLKVRPPCFLFDLLPRRYFEVSTMYDFDAEAECTLCESSNFLTEEKECLNGTWRKNAKHR